MKNLIGYKLKYWGLTIGYITDVKPVTMLTTDVTVRYTFWYKVVWAIAYLAGKHNIRFIENSIMQNRIIADYRLEEARLRCIR